MTIKPFLLEDLAEIAHLRPEGWSDLSGPFSYYLSSPFCYPVKVVINGAIAGLGSYITFEDTAWLAHIIVHPDYRNRGIGGTLVKHLLDELNKLNLSTILLLATDLGKPVYKKAGFKIDTEYYFYNEGLVKGYTEIPPEIIFYDPAYFDDVLKLDKKISGENRKALIAEHIPVSRLFVENNKLIGFYLPTMGDGLIIADSDDAGVELMKYKYSIISKAVLPANNKAGIDFLLKNNYTQSGTGTRMWIGKKLKWYPEKLFSRIGGHVG